jgi:hypothetical protein
MFFEKKGKSGQGVYLNNQTPAPTANATESGTLHPRGNSSALRNPSIAETLISFLKCGYIRGSAGIARRASGRARRWIGDPHEPAP